MANIEVEEVAKGKGIPLRELHVKVGEAHFIAPTRSLAYSEYRPSNETVLASEHSVIEVFRRITADKLASIRHNPEEKDKEIGKWLRHVRKSKSTGGTVFFILKIEGENIDKASAKFLADTISKLGADIVSTPITLDHNPAAYAKFIEAFNEEFKSTTYGAKTEVAYTVPPNILKNHKATQKLLETYSKKKPTILLVDYNGSNPFSTTYTSSTKRLHTWKTSKLEKALGQLSITYGINIKPKSRKYPLPARDLATLFLDFNILGSNHIPLKLPKEVIEKIKETYKPKLLNIGTYGYLRMDEAKDQIPEEYTPKITLNMVQQYSELYKVFNAERQLIETRHIIDLIEKEEDLKKYIKSKEHLDNKAKKIILNYHTPPLESIIK